LHALRLRLAFRLRFALGSRLGEDDRALRYGRQRVLRDACLRDRDSRQHCAGEQREANSLIDLFHCERGGHMFLQSIVKNQTTITIALGPEFVVELVRGLTNIQNCDHKWFDADG
jgi:hypothetical protein